MLIIPLKATSRYDIKPLLIRWLDGPEEGALANPMEYVSLRPDLRSADCYKEIQRLASIRNCLADAITKQNAHKHAIDELALQDCHEYHAVLLAFSKHGCFPDRDEVSNMQLEWTASYGPQKHTHGSVAWERACTLWNVAALESFLASTVQGKDKENRKQAIKHYQNAAMAMALLQRVVVQEPSFEGVDFSKPSLHFWERGMLAHAQNAAYEMTLATSPSKHTLLSFLAMGAVSLWNEALTLSKDPMLHSSMPKPSQEWGTQCKGWSMLLTARAELHQSLASRDSKGMEIARLRRALTAVRSALDFYQTAGMEEETQSASALERFVRDRKEEAEKDNRFYGEDVPSTIPSIRSHIAVGKWDAETGPEMPESMTKPKVALFTNIKK